MRRCVITQVVLCHLEQTVWQVIFLKLCRELQEKTAPRCRRSIMYEPVVCLSATSKDVCSVLSALYPHLFFTSCPHTALLCPPLSSTTLFITSFPLSQDPYLTLQHHNFIFRLLTQWSHDLVNYISPEKWQSAKNKCLTQVTCYRSVLACASQES